MKRVNDLTELQIGKMYFVKLGIWQGNVIYCGEFFEGKRKKLRFTYGPTVESWVDNFNLVGAKSNFKVYELEKLSEVIDSNSGLPFSDELEIEPDNHEEPVTNFHMSLTEDETLRLMCLLSSLHVKLCIEISVLRFTECTGGERFEKLQEELEDCNFFLRLFPELTAVEVEQ